MTNNAVIPAAIHCSVRFTPRRSTRERMIIAIGNSCTMAKANIIHGVTEIGVSPAAPSIKEKISAERMLISTTIQSVDSSVLICPPAAGDVFMSILNFPSFKTVSIWFHGIAPERVKVYSPHSH